MPSFTLDKFLCAAKAGGRSGMVPPIGPRLAAAIVRAMSGPTSSWVTTIHRMVPKSALELCRPLIPQTCDSLW